MAGNGLQARTSLCRMSRSALPFAHVGLLLLVGGCGGLTEVRSADLARVVQRDAVTFEGTAFPAAFFDMLAAHSVVLIGEQHHLREHREFLAALVDALHARGFRQVLVEFPQMGDWLAADYVDDGGLAPGWSPPAEGMGGAIIIAVREINRTLPSAEHIRVKGIDVNLSDYGGGQSFRSIVQMIAAHLSDPGPVATFLLAPYTTSGEQETAIGALRTDLTIQRAALVASWGQERFDLLEEMAEVEAMSVTVRSLREGQYDRSVRLREDMMKSLTDRRLSESASRTVINVGGNHAQKSYLKGTEQEWLGDYLVHRRPAASGSVLVVSVNAARVIPQGGGAAQYRLGDSPPNELFRTIDETWPGKTVYLPLHDPMFSELGIPVNYEETIYVCALREVYDAVLQYPVAQWTP